MADPTIELVTLKDPSSVAAEAFRTLRTNIQFSGLQKPIKTLLVTSPAPDEGKSVTIANLAVTMAQSGHSTILVDADLRRPSQHTLWGLPNEKGLTTVMLESKLRDLPLQATKVDNLSVLTSGPLPPNPADLISTRRMDEILKALTDKAEIVLFDAPPVLAVTDTALLGSKLDALLLVVKAGATRRDHAQRAKELLERASIRVIGVALTNAPRDTTMNSYYGVQK
jgi:capsular exopolysaccharide synthesis family protein